MRASLVLAVGAAVCALLPASVSADLTECTARVASLPAATAAVGVARPGAVICLADGAYGPVVLDADKEAPGVTLRAEHPGQATIAGASVDGSHLTIAQFRIVGTYDVAPGSRGMTASHNFFDLDAFTGYGAVACASTDTTCDDVSIVGNRFVGRAEEDAIRANRYHDGPDADRYGLLVEGNEFSGNQETGDHNDALQSVWVGDGLAIRRNYLHDFGGQGILVKDQATPIENLVIEDNLIVEQDLPCDPVELCPTWQLSPLQVFGPVTHGSIRHNTVWPGKGGGVTLLRDAGFTDVTVADNVFGEFGRDDGVSVTATNNTRCATDPVWTALANMGQDCAPAGAATRGITWRLVDQQFGPAGTVAPPAARGNAPVARFSAPPAPRPGQPVTFDASATACDDAPCTYAWSDEPSSGGAWPLGTGTTLRFTFAGAGTKHVTLRVTDADGDVGRVERDVAVVR